MHNKYFFYHLEILEANRAILSSSKVKTLLKDNYSNSNLQKWKETSDMSSFSLYSGHKGSAALEPITFTSKMDQ